jgi:hypothetical protein
MASAARPGQFVIVMSHERGERIPLTIADFDAGRKTITLVIQAVGKTTREMQQTCQGRLGAVRDGGPDGFAEPCRRSEEDGLRGWGARRRAGLSPGARRETGGSYVIGVVGFRTRS